jgi:electron transfer flavoprotein beta subunit
VKIVILAKPVPDATGQERLGPDLRLDRAAIPPVINGNDEYVLEAALRLRDAGADVSVTLLAMAGAFGPDALRKGLAMGADNAFLVTDPALAGTCARNTTLVLAAALSRLEFDLVLAGVDSSDGNGGIVPAGVAALLGLPYLSWATTIVPEGDRVRIRRISPTGYDSLEAPLPALVVGTQALGEPRYPTLRGIMGARSKTITTWSLADLGLDPAAVGGEAATARVTASRMPTSRGSTQVVRETPAVAATRIVDFLVERRAI